jgi:hypothetical protein
MPDIEKAGNDAMHQPNPELNFICYDRAPVFASLTSQPMAALRYMACR